MEAPALASFLHSVQHVLYVAAERGDSVLDLDQPLDYLFSCGQIVRESSDGTQDNKRKEYGPSHAYLRGTILTPTADRVTVPNCQRDR